jgi:hypothetical protein
VNEVDCALLSYEKGNLRKEPYNLVLLGDICALKRFSKPLAIFLHGVSIGEKREHWKKKIITSPPQSKKMIILNSLPDLCFFLTCLSGRGTKIRGEGKKL